MKNHAKVNVVMHIIYAMGNVCQKQANAMESVQVLCITILVQIHRIVFLQQIFLHGTCSFSCTSHIHAIIRVWLHCWLRYLQHDSFLRPPRKLHELLPERDEDVPHVAPL